MMKTALGNDSVTDFSFTFLKVLTVPVEQVDFPGETNGEVIVIVKMNSQVIIQAVQIMTLLEMK